MLLLGKLKVLSARLLAVALVVISLGAVTLPALRGGPDGEAPARKASPPDAGPQGAQAKSTAQMISETERGVLVTRLWYIREVEPYEKMLTGMTRDGTFLIEDGKITRALANVRYTMSALELFAGIELLGAQRLARDWWSSNGMGSVVCVVPPMKVRRATITGSSPR